VKHEENKIQEALVRYVRLKWPNVLFTCAPAAAKDARTGARNKRMGYLKGFPDLFFAYPLGGYLGLFLELKTATGKETSQQKEIREQLNMHGYKAVVCYGYDEAIKQVENYFK